MFRKALRIASYAILAVLALTGMFAWAYLGIHFAGRV